MPKELYFAVVRSKSPLFNSLAMKGIRFVLLSCAALSGSCGFSPERHVKYHDARLVPFLNAIARVNRDSLGFTSIKESDDIEIEGASNTYDAMLHVYGKTSRTIAFAHQNGNYAWIGEQEIHRGPRKYTTPDGVFEEKITITFEKQPVSGVALNRLAVDYRGPDSTIAQWPDTLKLNEALQILNEWEVKSPVPKN